MVSTPSATHFFPNRWIRSIIERTSSRSSGVRSMSEMKVMSILTMSAGSERKESSPA